MKINIRIGSLSIDLPAYMSCLHQEEIDSIVSSTNEDKKQKIIAAGVHPTDGIVTFILASGQIISFDGDSYYIPRGRYIPQADGNTIFLPNEFKRWPIDTKGFSVLSSWLISKSSSLLTGIDAELLVSNISLGIVQT